MTKQGLNISRRRLSTLGEDPGKVSEVSSGRDSLFHGFLPSRDLLLEEKSNRDLLTLFDQSDQFKDLHLLTSIKSLVSSSSIHQIHPSTFLLLMSQVVCK